MPFASDEARLHWNAYNSKYSKENYKTLTLKLNKYKDRDIIEFLEKSNKKFTDLFKEAIRKKIKEGE